MQVVFLNDSDLPSCVGVLFDLLLAGESKVLTRVIDDIRYIAQLGGHPQPPRAKPLFDVTTGLCEIRSRYSYEELLRIYYFVDTSQSLLVLMNYTLKPDGERCPAEYEGKKGRKLQQQIQDSITLAHLLYSQYSSSFHLYEPFPHC